MDNADTFSVFIVYFEQMFELGSEGDEPSSRYSLVQQQWNDLSILFEVTIKDTRMTSQNG